MTITFQGDPTPLFLTLIGIVCLLSVIAVVRVMRAPAGPGRGAIGGWNPDAPVWVRKPALPGFRLPAATVRRTRLASATSAGVVLVTPVLLQGSLDLTPALVAAVALLPLVMSAIVAIKTPARYWRAIPATSWAAVLARRRWAAIDDGRPPRTPEEGLARLEERPDAEATEAAGPLGPAGRLDELAAMLAAWQPRDQARIVIRERNASRLRWYAEGIDDLAATERATDAIADPDARRVDASWNLYERAFRRAQTGEDPFPPLVEAAQALRGHLDADMTREVARQRRLLILRVLVVPAAQGLLVVAVNAIAGPGLAIVAGYAALVAVPAVRSRMARRR